MVNKELTLAGCFNPSSTIHKLLQYSFNENYIESDEILRSCIIYNGREKDKDGKGEYNESAGLVPDKDGIIDKGDDSKVIINGNVAYENIASEINKSCVGVNNKDCTFEVQIDNETSDMNVVSCLKVEQVEENISSLTITKNQYVKRPKQVFCEYL